MSVETALDAQFLQIYHQAAAKLAECRDAGTFAGYVAQMLGYPLLFLSPHPRNNTANVTEIPATIRKRSEYTPNAADTFSQESPAILPA